MKLTYQLVKELVGIAQRVSSADEATRLIVCMRVTIRNLRSSNFGLNDSLNISLNDSLNLRSSL